MASSIAPSSLSVTLSHAIAYLTRSLDSRFDLITVSKLRVALEAELRNAFAASWDPCTPLRGSGLRCLPILPTAMPPRPIHNACVAAGVQWSDWAPTLGGLEFDMFIDPGHVSVRFGMKQLFTVWSASPSQRTEPPVRAQAPVLNAPSHHNQATIRVPHATAPRHVLPSLAQSHFASSKTVAQQVCEAEDHEDLFNMIAEEIAEPAWLTPIIDKFPSIPVLSSRPTLSVTIPTHSRSSSAASSVSSSSGSSGYSFSSMEDSLYGSSAGSLSSTQSSPPREYRSRRTRQRESKVFVDMTKKDVTPYDGGKTTVLGGGVMLGAPAPPQRRTHSKTTSVSWRIPTM